IDPEHGPVACAGCFDLGARGQRLLIVVHHLAVDGVSWRILLRDLDHACRAPEGAPPRVAPEAMRFSDWARRLPDLASKEEIQAEWGVWEGMGEEATLARDGLAAGL